MADAASAWAHEAERLRARLGAPSPAPNAQRPASSASARGGLEATPSGRAAAAVRHDGAGLDAVAAYAAHGSTDALPAPRPPVAGWSAAGSGGPPPLSGLLKGLQVLSDAGAGSTPFGAAAIAEATAEARRGALAAVRREASRLAASVDVEAARRADAEASLARERAARSDDAAAHAAAIDALQAVVASKDAEIAQLRMALANRPIAGIVTASGGGRGSAEAEARAAEAEARAARAERALAASRAVETELSALLLAERRREAAHGRDAAPTPAARAAAEWGAASAAAGRGSHQTLSSTQPREGRLSHVLLSAALEA